MAYEMQIRGTQNEVKVRNPWAAALLPIITLGIYHFVWWYKINKELKALRRREGLRPRSEPDQLAARADPRFLIIVPPLVSYWNGTKRVQGAAKIAGKEPVNGWIVLHPLPLHRARDVGLPAGLAQPRLGAGSRPAAGPRGAARLQRDAAPGPLEADTPPPPPAQ